MCGAEPIIPGSNRRDGNVNLVFSTQDLPQSERFGAWRGALCDHYIHLDTAADTREAYDGFIRKAQFGEITFTDCFLSPQTIERRTNHIALLDKDCVYVALPERGSQVVQQRGRSISYGPGTGAYFSASEPYVLHNAEACRGLYLEFPREAIEQRSAKAVDGLVGGLNTSFGLGRVIGGLCGSMVVESNTIADGSREQLGEKVLDLLAVAFESRANEVPLTDSTARTVKLRLLKGYIDANIGNPLLSPERVAKAHQMSVRSLHYIFKGDGQTVSDYIWNQRLERCKQELQLPCSSKRRITEIALASGFNSMSHFSSLFRRRYGMTPTEARDLSAFEAVA